MQKDWSLFNRQICCYWTDKRELTLKEKKNHKKVEEKQKKFRGLKALHLQDGMRIPQLWAWAEQAGSQRT